ncbi:ABC transporter [Secundilactobacillus paracollinoides]|uniref:ABC transporter n=3 Tax=Secundilactobacillus paracollinoides TaxID=240427 RepID=A0A1B2IX28_9LACO|nr:ABC transporter ATP-binding protein [Secundilactobacillus paracollinoides]ANZ60799.1 ABC transporter [Secundilactobacillus paracollinoides]ANZ65172.1 ABC transporter [Secundilactobacillus paracollinoides]ANZ66644.1 ABC transporter [Secundilactobacillus paracollinoides]
MNTIISATHLSAGYGHQCIIKDQNIAVQDGVVTGLIGPNGSGKSTLLNVLNGFETPMSGEVMLQGHPLLQLSAKKRAQKVAFLAQHPVAPDGITVHELVSFGRYCHSHGFRWLNPKDRNSVAQAIQTVHLTDYRDHLVADLSGGQRQRAFIAMTLAQDSPIMMLDEPTTYLDLTNQLETLALLRVLNRQYHKTVVLVLHDLNQAAYYCDQLICMFDGTVKAVGAPEDVITPALLRQEFHVSADIVYDNDEHRPQLTNCHPLAAVVNS